MGEKAIPLGYEKVLFQNRNEPTNIFAAAIAKLVDLGYERLLHSQYFPDLVFFFLVFKSKSHSQKFKSIEDVIIATKPIFQTSRKRVFQTS